MLDFKGLKNFRTRLICATLSGHSIRITEIRIDAPTPGLTESEAILLRILEQISNGCVIEIDPTGTSLLYKPGILVGGTVAFACNTERNVGYYLEMFCILGLFGKQPLCLRLEGVTNDDVDVSVDIFKSVTLPIISRLSGMEAGLELKVHRRGASPCGGGLVELKVPIIRQIPTIQWTDEGMVKRIRGIAYSMKVSSQFTNRMVEGSRELLNHYLADVHIFTDAVHGKDSGNSPGYGMHLVAETTTGCLFSSEACVNKLSPEKKHRSISTLPELSTPEDVGKFASASLLEEIEHGGVVDRVHQPLVLLLCALGPELLSEVRLGPLTPQSVAMLRLIQQFFGLEFSIRPEKTHGTLFLSCVGIGIKNISRRAT